MTLTKEELELMSKGVTLDNEQFKLMQATSMWQEKPNGGKQIYIKRRDVRRQLFKALNSIRKGTPENITIEQKALINLLKPCLNPNLSLSWDKFTFTWDIHPKEPLQIVQKHEWQSAGGGRGELDEYLPTAFTQQETLTYDQVRENGDILN